jgi:hypothetical protein
MTNEAIPYRSILEGSVVPQPTSQGRSGSPLIRNDGNVIKRARGVDSHLLSSCPIDWRDRLMTPANASFRPFCSEKHLIVPGCDELTEAQTCCETKGRADRDCPP